MNWIEFKDGVRLNLDNVMSITTGSSGKYEILFHMVDGSVYVASAVDKQFYDDSVSKLTCILNPSKIQSWIMSRDKEKGIR